MVDSNCNGIYGLNVTSGLSWEEELCEGSSPMGLIYLGRGTHHFFNSAHSQICLVCIYYCTVPWDSFILR
jgi:hypothetical protein